MKVLNYTLKMNDQMSSTLNRVGASSAKATQRIHQMNRTVNAIPTNSVRQFGNTSNTAFMKVQRQTDGIIRKNQQLSQSYHHVSTQINKASASLDNLNRKSNSTGASSDKSGSGGLMNMIGGFKGMATGAAIGIAMAAIPAATGFVSDSINKALERQQIQTSFNVLAGSDQAGSALTNQLVNLQKDTVLGSEVFKNAQTMLGFGFDSSEVYDNLKMLGDVSMGDAGKLESLTLAFSQIRAAGKLAGQDLLQLINAGFNPLETMSQKTGKSIGVLKDQMSKGLITFEMVQQAFRDATGEGGRFENMLQKIADTPAGKVQQLAGEWDEFKISVGAAFMPLVSMALDFAKKMMPIVESVIIPLTNGVQKVVDYIEQASSATGGWMDYFFIIKDLFVNYYIPYISAIWDFISSIVVKVAEFAKKSEFVKDMFEGILIYSKTMYTVITWIIGKLTWLFNNVVMPILDKLEQAYRWFKELQGKPIRVVTNKTTNKAITAPNVPGDSSTGSKVTNLTTGSDVGKDTANSIASGGTKTNHITINLDKLVETININKNGFRESTENMTNQVLDALTRLLSMAQGQVI